MNNFDSNFNDFVQDRFDDQIKSLEKNNHIYKNAKLSHNKLLTELKKELTAEQVQKLDDILSMLNTMSSQEITLAYKTALQDILIIKEQPKWKRWKL